MNGRLMILIVVLGMSSIAAAVYWTLDSYTNRAFANAENLGELVSRPERLPLTPVSLGSPVEESSPGSLKRSGIAAGDLRKVSWMTGDELVSLLTAENAESIVAELKRNPQAWARKMGRVYRAWGREDAAAALKYARANEGPRTIGAVRMAVAGWATGNMTAAKEWVAQQPSGRMRAAAAVGVLKAVPDEEIGNSAKWVMSFAEDPHSKRLSSRFAERWAAVDGGAAAEWVLALSDGRVRADALRSVLTVWGKSDPTEASSFLGDLSEGTARDSAVAAFSRSVAREDLDSAVAWAETISDAQERARVLQGLEGLRPASATEDGGDEDISGVEAVDIPQEP